MATLRKQLGAHLRHLRADHSIRRERFAETLNVSVDYLSLVKLGINAPSIEILRRIAKQLRVPAAELFKFDTDSDSWSVG